MDLLIQEKIKQSLRTFESFFGSGCSSTIVVVRMVEIIHPKKADVMQWHTQSGNILIVIIISHGLYIYTICLLAALHVPPVIPGTVSQVSDNVITQVFVSYYSCFFG